MNAAATLTSGSAPAPASKPPLDDVMLAMDVVDTLRRRERIVQKELDEVGREEDLKERLRRIYAAQGIAVPDSVIEQGVAALKEDRFTYKPPPDSFVIKLARIYVNRGVWGTWLGGLVGAGALAGALYYFVVLAPNAALPDTLEEVYAEAVALAKSDQAQETLERSFNAGRAALRGDDKAAVREAIRQIEDARDILEQEYRLRIVNRPDEKTGVWRIPDINTGARNFYLLVEAVDPTGRVLTVPIENEETRKTERVKRWGLRVDERTFKAVAADKQDDGIIERDRFGQKTRGELVPRYEMKTTGGAITQW
ncbi:DUF6384 family protein [Thiocystis violascens]|uniref:Uncharacterized protein n=1 Tax=Thiocystis violascens (strain ATCC 17096 / DSM 198 / 6111) TaxID=765911 RepID=I3YAW4_THIV6|nr:DUF6384 family protein [Thiocystis violascens]AFL74132.1 hypothetical protein Thivi_2182 [Thiocystis violascens DSM 198]